MNTLMRDGAGQGIVAWLGETRVCLPLKGVEIRFEAAGEAVHVAVEQIWHHDGTQVLDCLYTFPLPSRAALYRCELVVNDRVIAAKSEDTEEARRVFAEKKSEGHRAVLVDQIRPNLFELALGNVAPGDVIVVRLAYIDTLGVLGDERSLRIPLSPAQRYIPGRNLLRRNSGKGVEDDTDQVPDASRISPPSIDRFHPDAAYVDIVGDVCEATAGFVCPDHAVIEEVRENGSRFRLASHGDVPDRDFVLRYKVRNDPGSRLVRVEGDGESVALVSLDVPPGSGEPEPQDVYVLLDRSSSMDGLKWTNACAAVVTLLRHLAGNDRFFLTLFGSDHRDLSHEPMTPDQAMKELAEGRLEGFGTGGGTEMLPALLHAAGVSARHSAGRRRVLVLLTDAEVGNDTEILKAMAGETDLRIHCLGLGLQPNDHLLNALACAHAGQCRIVSESEDLAGQMSSLAPLLLRPLRSLSIGAGWELAGPDRPNTVAGARTTLVLLGAKDAADPAVSIDGERVTLSARAVSPTIGKWLPILAARQRVDRLIGSGKSAEARGLARLHNLVCDGMSFVAWDEKERVSRGVEVREVYQPAMSVFAAAAVVRDRIRPMHSRAPVHFSRGIQKVSAPEPPVSHADVAPPDMACDLGPVFTPWPRGVASGPSRRGAGDGAKRPIAKVSPDWLGHVVLPHGPGCTAQERTSFATALMEVPFIGELESGQRFVFSLVSGPISKDADPATAFKVMKSLVDALRHLFIGIEAHRRSSVGRELPQILREIERALVKGLHEIDPSDWVVPFRLWLRELWAAREDGRFQ